jgi:hypothetical protein
VQLAGRKAERRTNWEEIKASHKKMTKMMASQVK